jgi:hypothetical protein
MCPVAPIAFLIWCAGAACGLQAHVQAPNYGVQVFCTQVQLPQPDPRAARWTEVLINHKSGLLE